MAHCVSFVCARQINYHEMLTGRCVKLLLNRVPGAFNVVPCHHLSSHKTSRSEQKQRSKESDRRMIKHRNQEAFHPEWMPRESAPPARSWRRPLHSPRNLTARPQSPHRFLHVSPLTGFSALSSLLGVALSSCTTSYSGFLLPVNNWGTKG